jgi:multidrug efflux pump subunit AcrA (membrane-fusion protein)
MTRKKGFWFIIVSVIVLGVGGYFYYNNVYSADTPEEGAAPLQTAVARRGDLTIFAGGAGQVVPAAEISLGFQESGVLSEMLVRVGEEVQQGQVLARLQTNQTDESIASSIADAELSIISAQQALESLYLNAETEKAETMQALAAYAEDVKDAQYQLDNYTVQMDQVDLDPIEALDLMKEQLDQARDAFEPYKYLSSNNTTRQKLLEEMADAQSDYNAAVKRLEYEYEVETAEANLEKARADYEKLIAGPNPDDIALAEAQLASAEAKLAQAQGAQVFVDLSASMDGTVLEILANVGENVNTTPIIKLADLSQPVLEVYLDEIDLDKVAVGYEVEVIFDALADDVFSGRIVEVNPSLITVSGTQVVSALAQLEASPNADPQTLLVGLNASVDVIAGKAQDAVIVPVEALRELSPGEYAVFVMQDGEPKLRVVTVGLMDFTSAEILTGLQPGEIVTTGIVETE